MGPHLNGEANTSHTPNQEKMGAPRFQIEAMTSVSPIKITEPRPVRHVLVSEPNVDEKSFRGCYHVVMYYQNLNEEEYAWVVAGWIVESLARALSEHPLLAGRLRRRKEEGEDGEREILEIVANDSGIRMVEARMSITLSEFLGSKEKDDLEPELVFWKDIDEQSPEYSPLFYVQVTNFDCGGYSIGISCSLLLAEILVVDNFLKKWADIHNSILPRNGETKTPLFYRPRLKNPELPPTNITSRTPYKNGSQSLLFKITTEDSDFERDLAMLCVNEAEKKLDREMGSVFSLFVKESREVVKVEICSKGEYRRQVVGFESQMCSTTWDEFGAYEVAFHEGNMPILVSRWIGSASNGNVVAILYPEKGVSAVILVTLPTLKP